MPEGRAHRRERFFVDRVGLPFAGLFLLLIAGVLALNVMAGAMSWNVLSHIHARVEMTVRGEARVYAAQGRDAVCLDDIEQLSEDNPALLIRSPEGIINGLDITRLNVRLTGLTRSVPEGMWQFVARKGCPTPSARNVMKPLNVTAVQVGLPASPGARP